MLQFPADATFSTLAFTAFVAGAVGSPHCAAMCGPLVVACSRSSAEDGRVPSFTLQQSGRFLGYVLLGALAATFGNAIDGIAARDGARLVPLVIGALLAAFGVLDLLTTLRRAPGAFAAGRPGVLQRIRSSLSQLAARASRMGARAPRAVRPFLLGAVSAILPCGMLHAVALGAAGARSPIEGAVLLAAFYCGTLPALALVAFGVKRGVGQRFAGWIEPARGLALIAAGVVLVVLARSGGSCCHGS